MPSRRKETAGDWLLATAKRNPEAVLVLAAGFAMLLRKGVTATTSRTAYDDFDDDFDDDDREESRLHDVADAVRESVSGAAEAAAEYAAEVGERVYETAATYASTAGEYAEEGSRFVRDQASRLAERAHSTTDIVLREQPLAVAVLGLAAGAALAAILPPSETERRTFAPARGKLADAADRAADSLREAADEAARDVKARVVDTVLSGSAEIAREAAETFATNLRGEAERGKPDKAGRA